MMHNTVDAQRSSQTRGFWIWQGIIIAASPAIGYGLAFLYEVGFCGVFKIPKEFITLNLTQVFIAAGSLIGIIFLLYWFVELFLMLMPDRKSPLHRELVSLLIISVASFALLVVFWGLWERVIYVAAIFICLNLFWFVFPLILQWGKGSYIEKLQAQRKIDTEAPMKILDYFISLLGPRTLMAIIAVVFLLLLSYLAGEAKALKQDEFLVPSTHPQTVVLRIYGENMICVPFDREEKEIQKSFFIIGMTDEPRPMLQLQRIGPLRVKGEQ